MMQSVPDRVYGIRYSYAGGHDYPRLTLKIEICRLIFRQPLYFQGFFDVKCQILMFCPCFCPYQSKQGQMLYCPTTISSSFADFFFASLVGWAYTFISILSHYFHGLPLSSQPCSAQYFPSRYSGSFLCSDCCIIRQKENLIFVIRFVCAGFV